MDSSPRPIQAGDGESSKILNKSMSCQILKHILADAKVHIQQLESTMSMRANMSFSTSPGAVSTTITEDGRPWTPVNGYLGSNEFADFTPGSILAEGDSELENELGEEDTTPTDPCDFHLLLHVSNFTNLFQYDSQLCPATTKLELKSCPIPVRATIYAGGPAHQTMEHQHTSNQVMGDLV